MKNSLLIFLTFLAMPFNNWAQSTSLPDPQPYFSAIIVNDIDASIGWYTTYLGFEILNKTELPERGFSQANLQRGAALLELIELDAAVAKDELLVANPNFKRIQGLFKFGFLVEDFDAWVEFLEASEVEFNGSVVVDSQSGKKMVIIKDPDGNRIQLFEK